METLIATLEHSISTYNVMFETARQLPDGPEKLSLLERLQASIEKQLILIKQIAAIK